MKKLACILMVLMLVVTGITPTFAMTQATEETAETTDVMPRVSYLGPQTSYMDQRTVYNGICESDYVMFNYEKLTVSAGAVNNSNATIATSYVTVRVNKYLPGGTYITVASGTIPVDGQAHNIVTGLSISTSGIYMISYSIDAGIGAAVDMTTFCHSYTSS